MLQSWWWLLLFGSENYWYCDYYFYFYFHYSALSYYCYEIISFFFSLSFSVCWIDFFVLYFKSRHSRHFSWQSKSFRSDFWSCWWYQIWGLMKKKNILLPFHIILVSNGRGTLVVVENMSNMSTLVSWDFSENWSHNFFSNYFFATIFFFEFNLFVVKNQTRSQATQSAKDMNSFWLISVMWTFKVRIHKQQIMKNNI